MTLRQLKYICEIAKHSLNMSTAAAALHTNQSGLSKQVKLLEEELGTVIFSRAKNRLMDITPEGRMILARAQVIVNEAESIKAACRDIGIEHYEPLMVAVTHTQAQYFLPAVVEKFKAQYPNTPISMRDASPTQVVQLVSSGEAEVGLAVHMPDHQRDLVILPCGEFEKVVVVPVQHPLTGLNPLTLEDLARFPVVMQGKESTTGKQILRAFETKGLKPDVILHATDSDVIKNYVRRGKGIAVLASVTFDNDDQDKLRALPAGHLFERSVTNIFVTRRKYLRKAVFDFIELCNPKWTRENVQRQLS